MDYLLSTNQLTKKYNHTTAVNHVDLHLAAGDIYGFIGRNGAGKTTFLKMISNMARPTSGSVELFGYSGSDLAKNNVFSRVGTLIEAPGLYPNLTAFDNVKLKCLYSGVYEKKYVDELLDLVGLGTVGKKKTRAFSLGMKQRLGIALALVGKPDLLVLDEPTNGLDPQGIADVRDIIHRLRDEKKMSFIISSHILEELSKTATRYGIIHEGNLLVELTRSDLLERSQQRLELTVNDIEKARPVLENMDIQNYKVTDSGQIEVFERFNDSGDITMQLSLAGVKVSSIYLKQDSLENFYLSLTGAQYNASLAGDASQMNYTGGQHHA